MHQVYVKDPGRCTPCLVLIKIPNSNNRNPGRTAIVLPFFFPNRCFSQTQGNCQQDRNKSHNDELLWLILQRIVHPCRTQPILAACVKDILQEGKKEREFRLGSKLRVVS